MLTPDIFKIICSIIATLYYIAMNFSVIPFQIQKPRAVMVTVFVSGNLCITSRSKGLLTAEIRRQNPAHAQTLHQSQSDVCNDISCFPPPAAAVWSLLGTSFFVKNFHLFNFESIRIKFHNNGKIKLVHTISVPI